MSTTELLNPDRAPRGLLDLYFKQLFEHLDDVQAQAVSDRIEASHWVKLTPHSYRLWMTYAKVELDITSAGWIRRVRNHEFTRSTDQHRHFLRTAAEKDIKLYHDVVFDKRVVGNPSLEGCSASLVSPVHFWFFMSCQQPSPSRPFSPSSPSEFFYHPLFLMRKYTGSTAPFVVPEYFLRSDADFDGLVDLNTSAYYVFPSFAKSLVEYVADSATQLGIGSFIDYYSARATPWLILAGTDVDGVIDAPHSILRTNWRWEEVLAMLYGPQQNVVVSRPRRICRDVSPSYTKDRRIIEYFERFARMAAIWRREN